VCSGGWEGRGVVVVNAVTMATMLLLALLLTAQPGTAASYIDDLYDTGGGGGAGGGVGYPCKISESVASPYVSAQFEMVKSIRGCISQEQSPINRFIYVVNIAGSSGGGGGSQDTEQQVDLYIRPITEGIHDAPMIFVLNSWQPTLWRIHAKSIANTTRNLVWLPEHSRISKDDDDISIRIKKFSSLSRYSGSVLEEWVRQQPRTGGCVTMFAEVREATKFFIHVGDDVSAPRTCIIERNVQSTSLQALQLYPQPAGGCFEPRNEGIHAKNVHIIELSGTNTASSDHYFHHADDDSNNSDNDNNAAIIEVDIVRQPPLHNTRRNRGGGEGNNNQNIVLVLHAPHVVRWRLRSHGVRGSLTVVLQQDHLISPWRVSMAPLNVIREDLSAVRKDALLEWVAEKHGPAVSYTNVQLANRFRLTVNGAAALKKLNTREDELALPSNVNPFSQPEKTHVAVLQNKRISCLVEDMLIVLSKRQLQAYGVQRSQLTLLDPSCIASENQTHYLLSTRLTDCGTYKRESNGIVFYQNAILVRNMNWPSSSSSDVRMMDDDDEEGSGSGFIMGLSDDEDENEDTHLDDEDYTPSSSSVHRRHPPPPPVVSQPIRVDFECEYSMEREPESPMVEIPPPIQDVRFFLQMFTDERFLHQERSFPLLVEESQTMYIEASVDGDDRLGVMVYSCWMSEKVVSSYSKGSTFHKYLDRGCLNDKSVHFLSTPSNKDSGAAPLPEHVRHLKLDYRWDYPDVQSTSYLQCLLEPCVKKDAGEIEGVQKCMQQEQYCIYNGIDYPSSGGSGSFVRTQVYRRMVYVGELERRESTPTDVKADESDHRGGLGSSPPDGRDRDNNFADAGGQLGSGGSSGGATGDTTRPCTTIVRMEGLDSGTVVGIAFAAFVIGVSLTAALWYIHTHTGPMQLRAHGHMRSNEASGESTPSSTAPITIHQVNPH